MDISDFARNHVSQITATVGLVTYAAARKKLTFGGILAGILVAGIHMLHPWPAFFWLLILFFLFGTVVTRIGHARKAHLTQSSTGGTGGEGARRSAQVFANSGFACVLILLHAYLLYSDSPFISSSLPISAGPHVPGLKKVLPVGIIAQYAAVAADTFSSELGILSKTEPFMITAPWKRVRKGTNGGVTVEGLLQGLLGSFLLAGTASLALRFATPNITVNAVMFAVLVGAGFAGSVIDSVLGALVQVTVMDKRSGRVVEGAGGQRVKVLPGGGRLQLGTDLLTNNGVNFVMAVLASLLAMGVVYELDLDLSS